MGRLFRNGGKGRHRHLFTQQGASSILRRKKTKRGERVRILEQCFYCDKTRKRWIRRP